MIKQSSKIFVSINIPGNRFSLNTNTQKQLLGTSQKSPLYEADDRPCQRLDKGLMYWAHLTA